MIVQEEIKWEGRTLVKTTSDEGYLIRQDGTGDLYEEAVDPAEAGRTYTETEIPASEDEAQPEDYEQALRALGVDV